MTMAPKRKAGEVVRVDDRRQIPLAEECAEEEKRLRQCGGPEGHALRL